MFWKCKLPSLQLIFLYVSFRVVVDKVNLIPVNIQPFWVFFVCLFVCLFCVFFGFFFFCKHAVWNPFRCALGIHILNYERWHICPRKHALQHAWWRETICSYLHCNSPLCRVHMSTFSCILCHCHRWYMEMYTRNKSVFVLILLFRISAHLLENKSTLWVVLYLTEKYHGMKIN